MREMVLAATAALMLGGVAVAADVTDPVWTKAPDRSDLAKAYPADAARTGAEGMARLRCTVSGAGTLQDCSVLQESPAGGGFGAAALSLTAGFELKTHADDGQALAGRTVAFPIRFTGDGAKPGSIIRNVDWLHVPDGQDFANYMPLAAKGRGGRAVVHCAVTNRGLMEGCQILSETPPDAGYGAATLLMTPSFVMRPMTVDGVPVGGGTINIPVRWEAGGSNEFSLVRGGTLRVVGALPWSATPTAAEMTSAFPRGAIGHIDQGHVVLRCHLLPSGKLYNCDSLTEDPKYGGFDAAARSLVRDFTAIMGPELKKNTDELVVNLPFDFRDPNLAVPPLEITDPVWIRFADPQTSAKQFPPAAIKAGLKTGLATVDCTVTHDGGLSGCQVASEDPPGLGFGAAALAIAQSVGMNPWTLQGAPVDGARVRVPIRVNLPDDGPAAAPRTPATPTKP